MAVAHAILLEAVPARGASVAASEIVFRLRFNSRVDAARSTLKLVLSDGRVHALAMGQQPSPDSLSARWGYMKSGHYTLRWQVLSADGHITRGEVPFEVR
jgi:methionine-rich copper-binding protein CopC